VQFDSNGKRIRRIISSEAKTQVAKANKQVNQETAMSNLKTKLENEIINRSAKLALEGKIDESADLMKKLVEAKS